MKKWPPDSDVIDYSGPYPVHDIKRARGRLIQYMKEQRNAGLVRMLPKIGIDSQTGPALVPPPPPQTLPNGLTPDACSNVPEKTPVMSPIVTSPLPATTSLGSVQSAPICVSEWTPSKVSRSTSLNDTTPSRPMVHQTELGTSREQQAVSIVRRRLSEFPSTGEIPAKTARGNGAGVASRQRGPTGDAAMQKNTGEPAQGSSGNGKILPPSHVYKCDYCRITATSDAEMTAHLTRSKHASASEYTTVSLGGDGGGKSCPELQAIERMLAVANPDSRNHAALVIACPECRSIFNDIFTCAMHSKYEHGEANGCYAVCPVIHSEKVELGETVCAACQQRFGDYNDLVGHWAAVQDHCPMQQSPDSRVFLVQTCPACKRTFNDDFLECVLHMAEEHGRATWVEVRHVMLPQRRERLPPFSSSRQSSGGLRDEAMVLAKLENCFEQGAINARLEQIQKMLAGVA